jgi:hypothetical protein
MRIDPLGRVLIGVNGAMPLRWWNGTTYGAKLFVENNGSTAAADYVTAGVVRNTNDGEAPQLGFAKSRGTTTGAVTVVQSGDPLGTMTFQGADGTNYVEAARINAVVDGTPGADDMPGRLQFSTTADGAASPTVRMTIDSAGEIVVNDSTGTEAGRITTIGNNLTISGTVVNHCGFSFATNAILPATQSATNNNTVDLGQNGNSFKDFYLAGEAKLAGITTLGSSSELTIASGGITITSSYHTVDTEGDAASDNLNTINGGSTGSILILNSVTSRSVTLKDDSDNLRLAGDFTLSQANDSIMLIKFGTTWREISRSTNG